MKLTITIIFLFFAYMNYAHAIFDSAQTQSVPITSFSYELDKRLFTLKGYLPNSCYKFPIKQSSTYIKKESSLIIKIWADTDPEVLCLNYVRDFSAEIDLRDLSSAEDLDINITINPNTNYEQNHNITIFRSI